jgi:hypothetical protein
VLGKPRYDASVGVFLTITVGGLLIDIHKLGRVPADVLILLNYQITRRGGPMWLCSMGLLSERLRVLNNSLC